MRRIVRALCVAMIGLSLVGSATAQGGQSLSVTLAFIRDKLAQQGPINYSGATHDSSDNSSWSNQFSVEASNVTIDAKDCAIGFHWRTLTDGKVTYDDDARIRFAIVTSVAVSSMEADIARLVAKDGHTTWTTSFQPPIWVVLVRKNDGHTNTADFQDQDTAERVAKAMRRAAVLCGGTKSEPF
jgi:hypothetical protein